VTTPTPADLAASRIAVMPDGAVAEVVITADHEARARWHPAGGAWSGWMLIAGGADDVSVTPDAGQHEGSALVSVTAWRPRPMGVIPALHQSHSASYLRLSASGVAPADL
jgi:hypothetical protein